MIYADIRQAAHTVQLEPLGGCYEGQQTIILLGPKEPGFWEHLQTDRQFDVAVSNPLDQWSSHIIGRLAEQLGAEAIFPFGGPPYHPFIKWALQSGQAWEAPVKLLVHQHAGLLVSYRGALRFKRKIDLPPAGQSPCNSCAVKPCLAACPVGAISTDGYDVPTCKAYISSSSTCRAGCMVRLACPISQSYPRNPAQTEFHMKAFHAP